MQQINVEEIMEQIRKEIKEKGYTEKMLSFHEVSMPVENPPVVSEGESVFVPIINQMRSASYIAWYRPVSDGMKGFVKKVIRKFVCFIIAPIADEQSAYNAMNVNLLEQLCNTIEKQEKELASQKAQIEELQKAISELK